MHEYSESYTPFWDKNAITKRISFATQFIVYLKPSLDKGCNTQPLQKEVDHHLDLDATATEMTFLLG